MKIHRFIVNFDLNPKKTGGVSDFLKIEDKEIINQIKNVLRLKTGENIILSDGKSNEILGEIQEIKSAPGEGLKIKIINIYENKNEPAIRGILYCALLKKENFELAVQKSVEAGIKEIIPVKTERTVKFNLKKDRVLKIMKEASEQSERGIIPELMEILDFKKASEEAAKNDFNFLFDKSGEPIQKIISRVAVSLNKKTSPKIGIFIGPEGGFTEKEINLAKEKKFFIVSLGNLTLRAETAATIASYLISSIN